MVKTLTGIAAAAMLTVAAAPAPANAAPIRHAPGLAQSQAGVDLVQYRWRGRGYGRGYRRGWYGPRYYCPRPYVDADPYAHGYYRPYYRRYYSPGPYVQFGPFGFGVW